ncbi:MAG: hypothetical protein AB1403_03580 [Candidatus Riflebacteria bacterium]
MNRYIIRFEKFCVKWAWLMVGIMGLISLFFNLIFLTVPDFLFAVYYFYRFYGGSLKEKLKQTESLDYSDTVSGSNPKFKALDAHFFPFAILTGVNFIILFFILGDRFGWI